MVIKSEGRKKRDFGQRKRLLRFLWRDARATDAMFEKESGQRKKDADFFFAELKIRNCDRTKRPKRNWGVRRKSATTKLRKKKKKRTIEKKRKKQERTKRERKERQDEREKKEKYENEKKNLKNERGNNEAETKKKREEKNVKLLHANTYLCMQQAIHLTKNITTYCAK